VVYQTLSHEGESEGNQGTEKGKRNRRKNRGCPKQHCGHKRDGVRRGFRRNSGPSMKKKKNSAAIKGKNLLQILKTCPGLKKLDDPGNPRSCIEKV